jgi:hypothetical protein
VLRGREAGHVQAHFGEDGWSAGLAEAGGLGKSLHCRQGSASGISCGWPTHDGVRLFMTPPTHEITIGGLPGGLGQGTEILTGVLKATVRDPSGRGPGARPIDELKISRASPASTGNPTSPTSPHPNRFHACEASPEGDRGTN